jgi:hypothetical protein
MTYYILEHPRKGVLRDLEETNAGRTGRFSVESLRGGGNCMRFRTKLEAHKARLKLPYKIASETEIRCSDGDGTYLGSWPVVSL